MLDMISVGDVTEDDFIHVDELEVRQEPGGAMLCMRFATKIAAQKVDKLLGGNAGNFAIGSRRLGFQSALWSTVGDDMMGKLILKSLKDDKVSTKYFTLARGEKTNYSTVLNYGAERTILVHHEKRNYRWRPLEKAKWIYVTSAGEGSERLFPGILSYIKRTGARLGFNPGTHQMNLGKKKLATMFANSEVLSINVEEAQFIFKTASRDLQKLLKLVNASGVRIALITDGPQGSYAYDGKEFWYCPIYDVPILERTGCGDGYTTGFIAALAYGKSVAEAMRWGTVNAAGVIQRIGPQAGLMKLSMLRKVLKANPKFTARKFAGAVVKTGTKYKPVTYRKF